MASWSAWLAASSCDQARRSRSYTRRSLGGQRRRPAITGSRRGCVGSPALYDAFTTSVPLAHIPHTGGTDLAQRRSEQPEQATRVLSETHLDALVGGPPGWFPGLPSATTEVTPAARRQVAPAVCDHHRGRHPSEPLNSHEERNLVMPHEPSGSLAPVQPAADRRCPSCRAVKPLDHFPAGTSAGCDAPCRRRSAAVARRHRQRTLRQVARRAEASYRALLAEHRAGSGDAA
jgi:hypothetical protein